MKTDARISALRLCALCAIFVAAGCGKAPVWSPAATTLTQKVEIPIELPARGIPGLVLRQSENPADVSLAVLDTGSFATIVSQRFATREKLKTRPTSLKLEDFQGKQTEALRVARVLAFPLADATFSNFDVVVADLPAMLALSERLDAVLGRSLFQHVLLTIDYSRRKLILETGALPEPNGADVLPLRRGRDGALLVPGRLLGEEAWLLLDTGNTSDGFTLSRYRLIAMPWASTPIGAYDVQTFLGVALLRLGRMNGDVTIGHYTIRRPIIGISFDDDVEVVGAVVLRNFVVTIDQKNNRVRLTRGSTAPIESPPVRRLAFTLTDDNGACEPLPGGEAERAGLRRGDRILTINGIPVRRFTSTFLEQLEDAGQPMDVRVLRAQREIDLMLPLTTLVP